MQTLEKRTSESVLYDIDCSVLLAVGETITGTPTVTTDLVTTPPLVFGVATVNVAAVTYTDAYGSTRVVPIGQVAQVNISGGTIPASAQVQDYLVRVKMSTTRNALVEATVRLRLTDTPAL